jgi:hypothetical protein
MIGVLAGLFVMFWSFGPAIYLLFLKEGYLRQQRREKSAASCPQPTPVRAPFQFHLRTIFAATFLTGILSGVLRIFWGRWPAMAVLSWLLLVVVIPSLLLLLSLRPQGFWLCSLAALCILVGLVAFYRQDIEEPWWTMASIGFAAVGLMLWRLNTPRGDDI